MNMLRLFRLRTPSTSVVVQRHFATKPQKKPVEKKKTAEEKARDAKKIAAKKLASENWNKKEGGEKSKHTPFFIKFMLNAEQRKLKLKEIHREPTLWEKQVAERYQYEMSRQSNRENYAIECAMRIRDFAIEALPTKELQQEARNQGRSKHSIPIYRRCAAWTPPNPKFQAEETED